jgi:hypothetical protein
MSLDVRSGHRPVTFAILVPALLAAVLAGPAAAAEPNYPVTPGMRETARQVAQAGVPLSDLAPNAPLSHTVQRGDTLWDISKLFLTSPWRWPELWGMNLDQIRNPHLIYPGQVLYLVKKDGRATLQMARPGSGMPDNTVKLSPRVRSEVLDNGAIASIPLHLIGPFLNEAVVFETDELAGAPRVVATQEGRVLLSRGETAYVRGDLNGVRDFRLFREPKALLDPTTKESSRLRGPLRRHHDLRERPGEDRVGADGKPEIVPATFRIQDLRIEAGVGDRLHPVPQTDLTAYAPHAPNQPLDGRVISIYGEALNAGQNQIVALNRGSRDGLERGHVLALWRAGAAATDRTRPTAAPSRSACPTSATACSSSSAPSNACPTR